MQTWLDETRHATASLIPLVWEEHQEYEQIMRRYGELEAETEAGYRQSQAFLDLPDDDGLATGIYWDTYFGPDKARHHAGIEADEKAKVIEARAFARSSLASSILQIAKQGISAVRGKPDQASLGRELHGVPIRDIVWQGRNQSMHWEEGAPQKGVVACFDQLAQFDPTFSSYAKRSLAFEVVMLLEWSDVAAFERDLLDICP